ADTRRKLGLDRQQVVRPLAVEQDAVFARQRREGREHGRNLLDGQGPYDLLPVEAELAAGVSPAEGLASRIEQAIKREIGVAARITLLAFNSLPRSEGKTRRVIRREKP
ncbi:MAG TPA: hypothetical protein VL101_00805, partial [Nordella sp.]|nr:hypothetical protein [Nordella sp.]